MIESIKISGFKNFRGKTIELTNLKRVNILVGINGSGKSSVLELMAGISRLSQLNGPTLQNVKVSELGPRLHSLFEPETEITYGYKDGTAKYHLKITAKAGENWSVIKEGAPVGGTEVIVISRPEAAPYNDTKDSSSRSERPFGGVSTFRWEKKITLSDIVKANELLATVNPGQRQVQQRIISGKEFVFEAGNEVRTEFLAGGTRYIAGLFAALGEMNGHKPLLLIDDLGDELYPAVRKALLPKLNELLAGIAKAQLGQLFATTHNIEVVKSGLDHPDYCSVYMFDYDGSLIEFSKSGPTKVTSSPGLSSAEAIPAIAKMLGLTDLELGFPEVVILAEEETKRSLLESLKRNSQIGSKLKKFDVQVGAQAGDGNVTKAIQNLLDLSKYFFYSEIWSERYVIFTDYNTTDYNPDGIAKQDSPRLKSLAKAQAELVLGGRFLLTRNKDGFVSSMEDTYPVRIWDQYKADNTIAQKTIAEWLKSKDKMDRGKAKNELAEYVGANIAAQEFTLHYPELTTALWA